MEPGSADFEVERGTQAQKKCGSILNADFSSAHLDP